MVFRQVQSSIHRRKSWQKTNASIQVGLTRFLAQLSQNKQHTKDVVKNPKLLVDSAGIAEKIFRNASAAASL